MAELTAGVAFAVEQLVALHQAKVVALVLVVNAALLLAFVVLAGF